MRCILSAMADHYASSVYSASLRLLDGEMSERDDIRRHHSRSEILALQSMWQASLDWVRSNANRYTGQRHYH
jgi:hypothetical protein